VGVLRVQGVKSWPILTVSVGREKNIPKKIRRRGAFLIASIQRQCSDWFFSS
jgi:hypothetical protein